MRAVDLIARKRSGARHQSDEVRWLIGAYLSGEVPDYQMASWLMAVCWQGLDAGETRDLTLALVESGRRLSFADSNVPTVDKHSTGGVGDKTTLVLAPMLAAAGVAVAKMSGRGLEHTGGTIDKLEAVPGVRTAADPDAFAAVVRAHRLAIASQSAQLAPGDGRLYALRDVTATVESIPLIASSVMSKKIATGARAIVLDVKAGSGAFMKDLPAARALAQAMVSLGREVGLPTVAVISSMAEPLGRAVGNALEVQEAIDTLRGRGPADLVELCLVLGSEVMVAASAASALEPARDRLARAVADGAALEQFLGLIGRLGGNPERLLERATGRSDGQPDGQPDSLPVAPYVVDVQAPRTGYLAGIDALACGHVAMRLGAGRTTKEGTVDPAVGLVLCAKTGERVERGAPLVTLHARHPLPVDSDPVRDVLAAFRWSDTRVSPSPLVLEILR